MLQEIMHGDICEIRLEYPPVNAIGPALIKSLSAAVESAGEKAQAIVLSGQPGVFSAGIDVPGLLPLDRPGIVRFWTDFFGLLHTLICSPVPLAFAITGHSPAGGAVLALTGDYRVMTKGDYVIGLNEVAVGLVPPLNLQKALARIIGTRMATRLVVVGALIPPAEAFSIGLVDALADDHESTIGLAVEWCQQQLAVPRGAMLATRKIARQELIDLFENPADLGPEALTDLWFSEETQAALKSMIARARENQRL